MKRCPAVSPLQKGRSGNPPWTPQRTAEEVELIEACREKIPEALEVIETLMHESTQEGVRLAAAPFIVARGECKAPQRIELLAKQADPRCRVKS